VIKINAPSDLDHSCRLHERRLKVAVMPSKSPIPDDRGRIFTLAMGWNNRQFRTSDRQNPADWQAISGSPEKIRANT
jgi:hypothetical protein